MKKTQVFVALAVGLPLVFGAGVFRNRHVGDVTPAGTFVPVGRYVKPDGVTDTLSAAVVDICLVRNRSLAIVKTSQSLVLVDLATGTTLSRAPVSGGSSMVGVALSPDGGTVAASNSTSQVALYRLQDSRLLIQRSIVLPEALAKGPAYPCGLCWIDDHRLAVAANRDNSVMILDTRGGGVKRIPVDPAPYACLLEGNGRLLVDCWSGGAGSKSRSEQSSGTPVEVDRRGIGVGGSLCRINLEKSAVVRRIAVLRQPTEMVETPSTVYVACANGDGIIAFDRGSLSLKETLSPSLLKGIAPNSICLDDTGGALYATFGGVDRVGKYDLKAGKWLGFVATAWYPSSVRWTPSGLVIGTAKGVGSRRKEGPKHGVGDFTATVSFVADPKFGATFPEEVSDGPARADAAPKAIPERVGEPSLIKHVVYVIKENRTYDQVLGDMTEGNGDPKLTMYGEQVTPNQHKIARQFVLLDNYYCNGILSADGHAWATEANATTFYERSHGGWTRSYPFGDDPLATSSTGYIWDNVLDHGKTVRNFGEFDYAATKEKPMDILHKFMKGEPDEFGQQIGVARLRTVSERSYPGWNLAIPDVLRADRFIKRLHELEAANKMADLTIVYLPQDHTSGGEASFPTPRAQVADNDLGVGRVLEALSHSKVWKDTVVFVEEDDPQDGFDHVDGHRSTCLVAGPYVRRGVVVSRFYNQASVVHTMEQILGLPTMNLNDSQSPLMTDCFMDTPDLSPYVAEPSQIALDEQPKMQQTLGFNLKEPDAIDDDAFNRRLWALSGKGTPYPSRYVNEDRDDK